MVAKHSHQCKQHQNLITVCHDWHFAVVDDTSQLRAPERATRDVKAELALAVADVTAPGSTIIAEQSCSESEYTNEVDEDLLWQDKLRLLIASYATDSPAPPRLPSNGWAKLKKSWCGKRNTGAAEWTGVGVDELLISTPDGELLQLTTSIA
eukprot:7414-Heterococcus_DN1.PRE.2